MKSSKLKLFYLMCPLLLSCNKDEKIIELLNSSNINEIIRGAEKAGASGKKKFVPMLLKNDGDLRTSTSVWHYGVSVYKAKMDALKEIFQINPPNEIVFYKVDYTIIEFYTELYKKER
jgi:hypothetical protein